MHQFDSVSPPVLVSLCCCYRYEEAIKEERDGSGGRPHCKCHEIESESDAEEDVVLCTRPVSLLNVHE